jgi:hypothetical protein
MNIDSISTTLVSQLQQGPVLQQVSQQLGVDGAQATQAIGAAVPMLLGALGKTSSAAAGSGPDLAGGLIASLLGDGNTAGTGSGVLGQVFGGEAIKVADLLGQKTGMDTGKASQVLAILAPMVMSYIANQLGSGNAAATGQPASGGGIGALAAGLLDQDGDGKLGIGDVLGLMNRKR